MQENIKQLVQKATANKKILFGAILGIIALTLGVTVITMPAKDSLAAASAAHASKSTSAIEIAVAGATSSADMTTPESSWPGELISLGNIPVQPSREGTISSWVVHIGQKVFAGDTLGTLAQSPAMPDTVAMVAEKAGEATMSRATVEAKRVYTTERIKELTLLRENTEQSLQSSQSLLGTDSDKNANLSMVAAKKEIVRAILRSTLAKTYPTLSGSVAVPQKWSGVTLISPVGTQNSRLRDQFPDVVFAAKNDLDTAGKSPVESGLAYYDLTIKLADASLPDGVALTDATLTELKTMLHEDQQSFLVAVDEVKKTELMSVDTKKASFEQLREIEKEIAMLTQDLAMAEGDVSAKETAYQTVKRATQNSSAIIAPKNGRISAIMGKPGEFVAPGIPVAVITGDTENEIIVRFRIPSNIRKPEIGATLYVIRPGFSSDMRLVRLIGVGSALDETGSVMADALLVDSVDWPIGASVRVMQMSSTDTFAIPLSSVWWNAQGDPNVWGVSSLGRVYTKKVTLGRTLGEKVEIYTGLMRGDKYIVKPSPAITEDMLIDDILSAHGGEGDKPAPTKKTGHEGMPGMEM